jgi:D-arabinose 1-dehydrogenase-like Zn-dependent alcohol dehydrogenase
MPKPSTYPLTDLHLTTSQYNKPYGLDEGRPTPKPGPNDLLVRVQAAGFCHSDAQALQGQFRTPSPIGLIPSHEIAGVVAATGSSYKGKFKVGDRVGLLNFKHACGTCPGCSLRKRTSKPSDPRFCDNRETAGFLHDGGFADYAVGDPETTVHLPDSMPFEQAAPLMCAGATVWGSLERATEGLSEGETVAIVGIGGLGHLGVQFAKALGFKVIAVDSRQAGRDLAMETNNPSLQPDLVVDSSDPKSASDQIYSFTNNEGVAVAVVCTDSIAANRWALQLLRIGGTLGLLGLPPTPWQFDADVIVFKELSIRGSYVAGRDATERMMRLVEEAGVRSHITQIGYRKIPEIVKLYEDKEFKGRLVVNMAD